MAHVYTGAQSFPISLLDPSLSPGGLETLSHYELSSVRAVTSPCVKQVPRRLAESHKQHITESILETVSHGTEWRRYENALCTCLNVPV